MKTPELESRRSQWRGGVSEGGGASVKVYTLRASERFVSSVSGHLYLNLLPH